MMGSEISPRAATRQTNTRQRGLNRAIANEAHQAAARIAVAFSSKSTEVGASARDCNPAGTANEGFIASFSLGNPTVVRTPVTVHAS